MRKVFTRAKPRSHQLLGGIKGIKEVEGTKCEVSAAGSCEDLFFFVHFFFLRKTVLGNKNQEQQISWTREALAPCSCLVDKESRPFLAQH